jgi:hypothetical protein
VACPIEPGAHTNTTVTEWPSGVTGTFKSKMRWASGGAELLCVELGGSLQQATRPETEEEEKEPENGESNEDEGRYQHRLRLKGLRKSRIEG